MTEFAPNLSHMGIFTDRPDEMQAFYTDMLGMVVSDTGIGNSFRRRIIFLTGDSSQHHQLVLVVREKGDPPGGGMFQLSFKVKSLDEIRILERLAKARNCDDMRALDHGNAWSLYFRDPDGNMIEVYMDTGWYVPQPFGDPLFLNQSDAEIRATTDIRVESVTGARKQEGWSADMASRLNKVRNAIWASS